MKQRLHTCILAAFALMTALNLTAAPQQSADQQMALIEKRMQETFLLNAPKDSEVEKIRATLNDKGQFDGIDYESTAFNSGDKKRRHHANLLKLVKAYNTKGKYYRDEALYGQIRRAIDYWVTANITDQNWWHRIIGSPKDLMPSLVLMKEELLKRDKELYDRFVDYELYSWTLPEQRAQEGANGTDICKFIFATAVITRNEAMLKEVMEKVGTLIRVVDGPKEEGIQPDWSFSQHTGSGRQLYLATYGREYVDGVMFFMEFTNQTDFALQAEKVGIIENLFLNGIAWMWYKNEIDPNQYGRKMDDVNTAPSFVGLTKRLYAMHTPRSGEIGKVLGMMTGKRGLAGNKYYPRHDYMIHRSENYMVTTRMTSLRTVGNEAGNGQGFENYHTGDGANYIKVVGQEYPPIFKAWNWRLIPGTTTVVDNKPMPRPMWGNGGQGGSDFAGGAANGEQGVCGFIYKKDSLTAHKAWFYFDGYFVALGSGITSARQDAPVTTVINQTALTDNVICNGHRSGMRQNLVRTLWHNQIGYRFEQTASAEMVDNLGQGILLITLDHGTAPQQADYAYAVYPALTAEEFELTPAAYTILCNTADLQAVKDNQSGIVEAVFYRAGTLALDKKQTLTVDAPVFVICKPVKGGNYEITTGSPYCDSKPEYRVNATVSGKK